MRSSLKVLFSCWTALIVFGCTKTEQPVRTSQTPVIHAVTVEKPISSDHSGDVYWQLDPARSNTEAQHTIRL